MPITEEMGWARRAAIVRDLRALIQTTYQARNRSDAAGDAWRGAAAQYHTVLEHSFKPEFLASVTALRDQQNVDIEPLIQFLEAAPYFCRSGYMTENVLRWLKRVAFATADAERIRDLILCSVRRAGWSPRAFWYYARLAPKVDSPEFRVELTKSADTTDPKVSERARHVLRVLQLAVIP